MTCGAKTADGKATCVLLVCSGPHSSPHRSESGLVWTDEKPVAVATKKK